MRKSYIVKQKIKKFLSNLPGFRNYFQMEEEIRELNRKLSVISEPIAKHYADLDLAAMKNRYSKRTELMRILAETDKKHAEPVDPDELEIAELLASRSAFVSIIIVNRNGGEKLRVLMNSFHERSFYDNFEIIFVDNASSDDSVSYMQSWKNEFSVKIIQNQSNLSFSAANNQGVREASGDYLLFLNNDTEVTDGWLDELLIALFRAEKPGAIGAKLIYPHIPDGTVNEGKSYRIQHTGISFSPVSWKKTFYYECLNTDNGALDDRLDDKLIERAGVTAAVLLIKKDVFEETGGFDEDYLYGYEDVDLGLKLVRAGYKNYCCPTCVLFHYESATQLKDYSEERENRWTHNAAILKGRWEKFLSEKIFTGKLLNETVYSKEKLLIAAAVHKEGIAPAAQRLLSSLENKGYIVRTVCAGEAADPYNIGLDADILLSLSETYNLSKIHNVTPYIKKIAWIEKEPEKWCRQRYFDRFDKVFALNEEIRQYIDSNSAQRSMILDAGQGSADQLIESLLQIYEKK